ncbi:MAG TPA: SPOR domain-containing protein [Candidatus Acidoferrum sp.]|jgi:DedD protein
MASGRRSAGERVLEGKHVIGLFLLMLVFSGVFFTLGYVMGRNQYDGQVRAETNNPRSGTPAYMPKSEPAPKRVAPAPATELGTDPATSGDKSVSGWDFSHTGLPPGPEPRLATAAKPTPTAPPVAKTLNSKASAEPAAVMKSVKSNVSGPLVPSGAFLLQVAALTKQDDALAIASSLQKRHFTANVQPPQKDKFYRVQVGPFKDQKAADAAKKGLEGAGYKAFYVKH